MRNRHLPGWERRSQDPDDRRPERSGARKARSSVLSALDAVPLPMRRNPCQRLAARPTIGRRSPSDRRPGQTDQDQDERSNEEGGADQDEEASLEGCPRQWSSPSRDGDARPQKGRGDDNGPHHECGEHDPRSSRAHPWAGWQWFRAHHPGVVPSRGYTGVCGLGFSHNVCATKTFPLGGVSRPPPKSPRIARKRTSPGTRAEYLEKPSLTG